MTFLCETRDARGALVGETLTARSWEQAECMARARGWSLAGELVQRGSAILVADERGFARAVPAYGSRIPAAV